MTLGGYFRDTPHRSRAEQRHTARYQGGPTRIHYPFHPRTGQQVEVIRRHRFKGTMIYVFRQPDDTLAQIPTWMCSPAKPVAIKHF